MASRVRYCLFSVCALLLCASLSAAADLQSGKRAYQRKDYATAFKELTPLAEQGNAEAELVLGKMYMMGQGVLKDTDEAMKWLKASAVQGNADAQYFLGAMYLLPEKDVPEGMKWLELSAQQGHQDAQLLLGKAYLQGATELPSDPVRAEMWLQLAARNNLDFYQAELSAAERQMSPDQIAKGKALAQAWKPKRGVSAGETSKSNEKPKS